MNESKISNSGINRSGYKDDNTCLSIRNRSPILDRNKKSKSAINIGKR